MEEITIKDALEAKHQMELDIDTLLKNFTSKYKLKVTSVELDIEEFNIINNASNYKYITTVEVKL